MDTKSSISIVVPFLVLLTAMMCCTGLSYGQACCSAGVPLLGALEHPSVPAGNLTTSIALEYNVLGDVLREDRRIDDATRERTAHVGLFELSVGLGHRLSLSILASAVWHERRVLQVDASYESVRTAGIGDVVVLGKYAISEMDLFSQREVSIGTGVKAPIGRSTLRERGILLPADLQPGSGAWDAIFWSYFAQGFMPDLPLTLFGNASLRITGTNARYGNGRAGYSFGNESVFSFGGSYRTEPGLSFILALRFRHVASDAFDGTEVPNTGGSWVHLRPALGMAISEQLRVQLRASLPLYRMLNGTQLTTSYTTMLQFSYVTSI